MPTQPDSSPEPEPRSHQPGDAGSKAISLAAAKAALERDAGRSGKEHWAAFEYDTEKRREIEPRFSIITSQPCFPHDADQPDTAEVSNWLAGLGFRAVTAGVHYRENDNLALFDVKPAKAIRSGGVIVPIDVIPMRPHGVMKSVLREVLSLH